MSGDCLCRNISHLLEDNLKLTRLNESVVCWMASIPAEWEKGGDVFNLPALSLQKMIADMKSWIKEIPAELRNQLENEGAEMSQEPESDCIQLEDTHDEMEQKEGQGIDEVGWDYIQLEHTHYEMEHNEGVDEDGRDDFPDIQKRNAKRRKEDNRDEITSVPEINPKGKIRIPRISQNPTKLLGLRFPCDQCAYSSTRISHLTDHKNSQHLGLRFPCDQCEYSATSNGKLKVHKNAKHLGLRFPCDMCEKIYDNNSYLIRHIRKKHL